MQCARAEPASFLPALCLQRCWLSAYPPWSWQHAAVLLGGRREAKAAAAQRRGGSLWVLIRSQSDTGSRRQVRENGTLLLLPGCQTLNASVWLPQHAAGGRHPALQDPLSTVCPSVPSGAGWGFHILPPVGRAQASSGGEGGKVLRGLEGLMHLWEV